MIPTLHPLADAGRRYQVSNYGRESQMDLEQAEALASGAPRKNLCWEVNNHASALYLTGHTEQALAMAHEALAIRRLSPILINIAVMLESLGRFEEALTYAREAV